jgi:hypothetical protein
MTRRNKYVTHKKKKAKIKKYFTQKNKTTRKYNYSQNKFKIKRRKTYKNKKLRTKNKVRSVKKGGGVFKKAKDLFTNTKDFLKKKKAINKLKNDISILTKETQKNIFLYSNTFKTNKQKQKVIDNRLITNLNEKRNINEINYILDKDDILKIFTALKKFSYDHSLENFFKAATISEIEIINDAKNDILIYEKTQSNESNTRHGDNFEENIDSINNLIKSMKEQLQTRLQEIDEESNKYKNDPLKKYDEAVEEFNKFIKEEKTWPNNNNQKETIDEEEFYRKKLEKLTKLTETIETTKTEVESLYE